MKDPKEKTSELTEQERAELKVEWLGVDGALVLLYIVLACIYGYGMLNSVDFIIGIMRTDRHSYNRGRFPEILYRSSFLCYRQKRQ